MFKFGLSASSERGSEGGGNKGGNQRNESHRKDAEGKTTKESKVDSVFISVEKGFDKLADSFDKFGKGFDEIGRGFDEIGREFDTIGSNLDEEKMEELSIEMNERAEEMNDLANELNDMAGDVCGDININVDFNSDNTDRDKDSDPTMVSKKELLKIFNISYGQLYRWKREGLIPDEWFIKQSVSTGQETFFRKHEIMPRIRQILDLKDSLNLENIKDIVTSTNEAGSKPRVFDMRTAMLIHELDPFILREYAKTHSTINATEAAVLYIISINRDALPSGSYSDLDFSQVNNDAILFIVSDATENKFFIIGNNQIFDKRIKIVKKFNIGEAAATVIRLAAEVDNGR